MPQLLLELFSEEIPARMQAGAARDLERMAREHLSKAGLTADLASYAGPRRLTLVAEGLAAATPDREEELKGPRTSAPEQALEGFLRKTGLAKGDLVERDGIWFASLKTPGRATADIIAEMVPAIMAAFPWPKSMRSGSSHFRWVRPLKRILCLFDGQVVPFEAGGVVSGDLTEGHRFMGQDHAPFVVKDFASYQAALRDHYVLLDPAERRQLILGGARAACAAERLELVEDEGLLDEVSGLSEWPVPILGRMDPDFLDLPAEVIRTSMRTHQKYFAVRDPKTGGLAAHFVVVANIEPKDGGAVIAAGNAKVLSARLNDARFFWDQDRAPGSFEKWLKKLEGVTFHAKLGTMAERVARIEALAREIAPLMGADPELAGIAARYCKADLASGMVGEFPELQGVMGGYYARAIGRASFDTAATPPTQDDETGEGSTNTASASPPVRHAEEPASAGVSKHADLAQLPKADLDAIADAIRDHYKPVGPSDTVPTAPVTVAVALADKLDTLVGFFAIDEKPTGSKDPYALRRAALGVVRLLIQINSKLNIRPLLEWAATTLIQFNPSSGRYPRTAESYDPQEGDQPTPSWADVPIATWLDFDGHLSREGEYIGLAQIGCVTLDFELDRVEWDRASVAMSELRQRLEVLDNQKFYWLFNTIVNEDFTAHPNPRSSLSRSYEALLGALPGVFKFLDDLLAFFADRLKVLLRDEGKRHDLVDAVFALGDDDLVRIVRRVEALTDFLATEDGANLLAGYKRATNILKAEEKKNPAEAELYRLTADLGALTTPEEEALAAALRVEVGAVDQALEAEDFTRAMRHLAHLRAPVDAFFDKVMVNADDRAVRLTRLRLLTQVRDTANRVADFSLISG